MVPSESQQPNILDNGRSSLPSRAKRALVTVTLILCAVITPCASQNEQLSCGKRHEDMVSLRIARGDEALLGEWPWHAAIFWLANTTPEYVCGGSIIHKNAVISSAHCFVLFNRLVHEDLITVHVGRVDLNTATDGQQVLNVSKIIPHPKFFTLHGMEYDIAILKLSTDIVMSWSVFPVCVWDMADDHRELVGETGTIVGFGLNENDELSGILQKAELTVVDVYECLDNDRETYGRVLSENMYCEGGKANVSACNGDSGGGMYFERDGTWFIRGIISFITMRPNAAKCDTSKYTVFTDVGRFSGLVMYSLFTPCKDITVPEDGTCNVAPLFDYNFLLVATRYNIMRVQLNGGQTFPVSKTFRPNGLDHDCAEGRFYWSSVDTNHILSAKYDGTERKVFIHEENMRPENLAVDWISRRLYWTNWIKQTIEVASLENPSVRTVLIYKNVDPWAIAVDPLRSKLYWVNSLNEETIEWSNLDGTNRQVLITSPQISDVRSISVSTATGELCYVEYGKNRIVCIDPFSKQIRTIASNLTMPGRLAVTDELFYWTDWSSKTIESVNMNGVRQQPILMPLIENGVSNIVTAVTDKCPLRYSPCAINNGDCPKNTVCLVSPNGPAGRSCIVKIKCKTHPRTGRCFQIILSN